MNNINRLLFVLLSLLPTYLQSYSSQAQDSCCLNDQTCFTTAFTAGYVFKQDCNFKQVYGHGMINCITVDTCYYPWNSWGLGAKVSYLRAKGHTSFLQLDALAQEVPVTFYARKTHDFNCGLQTYISLGGGITWIKEKSYLGNTRVHKGIGEVEVGLNYHLWRCLDLVSAFRYLFPRQSNCCTKVDVGGCDLRAGIGFSF